MELTEWTHHHVATDGSQVKNKVALGVVVVHTGPRPGTASTAAAVGDTPKLDAGNEAVEVEPDFFRAVHAEGCIRPRYVGLHQQCNQDAEATAMADGLEVPPAAASTVLYSDSNSWLQLAERAADPVERQRIKFQLRVQGRSMVGRILQARQRGQEQLDCVANAGKVGQSVRWASCGELEWGGQHSYGAVAARESAGAAGAGACVPALPAT